MKKVLITPSLYCPILLTYKTKIPLFGTPTIPFFRNENFASETLFRAHRVTVSDIRHTFARYVQFIYLIFPKRTEINWSDLYLPNSLVSLIHGSVQVSADSGRSPSQLSTSIFHHPVKRLPGVRLREWRTPLRSWPQFASHLRGEPARVDPAGQLRARCQHAPIHA